MVGKDGNAEIGTLGPRSRILAVATQSFQRIGFRRTSMDAIAKAARMSKRTLYECFTDKHAVLEAVLTDFITGQFEAIARLSVQPASSREVLVTIGHALKRASADDLSMALYRVLVAEADHIPSLSDSTNRMGVDQVLKLMREPLADLGVQDAATAARIAYDLLVLAPMHRRLMHMQNAPIYVDQVIDLIVKGLSSTADHSKKTQLGGEPPMDDRHD
jgi:AcrR family transcriptional regulator